MNDTAMSTGPVLSVVTPLYNEEAVTDELIRRIDAALRETNMPYEMVMVDNGSLDATPVILQKLKGEFPALRTHRLRRNFGHMPGLTAGLTLARGKAVVVLDGDLQDPPELIPALVEEWKKGAHVVHATRISTDDGLVKTMLTHVFNALMRRSAGIPYPRNIGSYSLLDRSAVLAVLSMPEAHRYFPAQRTWTGGRQVSVPYERNRRKAGRSRIGLRGLFRMGRSAIYGFSSKPLIGVAVFSFISACMMLIVGLSAIVIRSFTDLAIPGWATFTTLIGFLGFTQSLVLMMLAEYIAIIYDETKRRPLFLLEDDAEDPGHS